MYQEVYVMVIFAVVYMLKLMLYYLITENHCRSIKKTGGVFYQAKNSKILKTDLFVVRIKKNGTIGNARPCYNCLDMMRAVKIRKVYYSISDDEIICENVKDMISIQASIVTKNIETFHNSYLASNSHKFYENLLIKYFPKIIRIHNLNNFILYNFYNVLPSYKIVINKKLESSVVVIYDNTNKIILSSQIIF
jgi:hypothetical protein